MLSSTHRFVSGDLPSTKWLRACVLQKGARDKSQGHNCVKPVPSILFFLHNFNFLPLNHPRFYWKKPRRPSSFKLHLTSGHQISVLMPPLSYVLNMMWFWEGFVVLQALKTLENTAYKLEEESERHHCLVPVAVPSVRHKEKLTARSRSGWINVWGPVRLTRAHNQSAIRPQVKVRRGICWIQSFGWLEQNERPFQSNFSFFIIIFLFSMSTFTMKNQHHLPTFSMLLYSETRMHTHGCKSQLAVEN